MLPEGLKKYFWDTDFSKLDLNLHKQYILERILEFGDENAVNWMLKNFSTEDIIKVVNNSRKISNRSLNFWKLALVR